jgi:type II secretion system protein C
VLELWLKALQVALLSGAVALFATMVLSFAGSSSSAEVPRSIDSGPTPPNDASLPRYRVIADRNLFKVKEKPVEAPVEPTIAESKLQVQLLGTVVAKTGENGEPEQNSLAIVRDTNGLVVTIAVGDTFAEKRAKLVRVEPRRIVLEQSGRLEAVVLEEDAAPPPSGRPAGAPNPNAMQDIARNMAQASSPDGAMMNVFRQLATQMVANVERDANGKVSGFRIQRINDGSPLQGIGLQAGDSIKGINGQSLGADGAAIQLFASFSGGADARLTVQDAGGRAREVVLPRAVLQRMMLMR